MVKMYKLTTQEHTTHNGMKWKIGQTNQAADIGNTMCTSQVLHCYVNPIQAVLLNPIHANIQNPCLFEIECSEIVNTDGLKYACKEQTPTKKIPLPSISLNQKIAIAIKLAMLVYRAASFTKWALAWLDGSDRSYAAARAAWRRADADAAAAYAARAAADAADAADAAARAAARAADAYAGRAYAYAFGKQFQEIINWVMDNII
jgi:hypothetical protein